MISNGVVLTLSVKFDVMKRILVFIVALVAAMQAYTQTEPWKDSQLLDPAKLAASLKNTGTSKPTIFCIGPQSIIPTSIFIGPTKDKTNLETFRKRLEKLPKNTDIVIYCGCCPFKNCPNIRPAFELLNSMKFTNAKLLDIPHNIRTDWINQGYPVVNQ